MNLNGDRPAPSIDTLETTLSHLLKWDYAHFTAILPSFEIQYLLE
jgi:hypothetical protein